MAVFAMRVHAGLVSRGGDAMKIVFTVPAVPIAQPRQRHGLARIRGKMVSRNYLPKDNPVHVYKACVHLAARQAYQGPPLEGPLGMEIVFVMHRPGRLRWKKKPMPRAWHTQKPDIDNLFKATADALKTLWRDDAQVCYTLQKKMFAAGDESPHVEIAIETLVRDADEA